MTMMTAGWVGLDLALAFGLDWMGWEEKNRLSLCILETNPAFLDLKCRVINSTKINTIKNTSKSEPPLIPSLILNEFGQHAYLRQTQC
jgi:hypothetical protein